MSVLRPFPSLTESRKQKQKQKPEETENVNLNPATAGPPRHPPAAGGGHKVAPLYFCDDIVATRRDIEAKLCTHLSEYLAEVMSKFGVDPI